MEMTKRILVICVLELLVNVNIQGCTPMTIPESKLKNSSLQTLDLIGQKMCVHQCSYHSDCKAVNFNKRQLTCELLTRSGREEPGYLQYDADSVHIHNITKDQISDFCSNKTCPAYHRCVSGKKKALCIISECSTQNLTLKNGFLTLNRLLIGDILEFTCANGYSKRNVTFRCLSSGNIENAEKLACYKKEGPWTIVFKTQSNSGAHPLQSYNNTGTQQERNSSFPSTCVTLAKVPGCTTPYRTALVDDWEQLKVQNVLFTVTVNSTFKQEIIFDGRNSSSFDWFSGSRVINSSWSDVTESQTYLFFDILGLQDSIVNRFWTIMNYHQGCPGDFGWFSASYNPPYGCSYDLTSLSYPVFRASPSSTACVMASSTVEAEAFSVSILAKSLI
ncbi:uncharacterized protein LOC133189648 [Saccostrea echinata]|uniref:uncharacterized protein LOC133189648 n=1 Tax=Saccostrea echinata TaxID=191078 RepID=UPI002A807370|nr:uncharacterized protein LOC133189648 [Saccostrea echinata]